MYVCMSSVAEKCLELFVVVLTELTTKEKDHVGEELSDVLLYLLDLAAKCHIDLPTFVLDKMKRNAEKYPVDKAYGRSDKYSDL